MKFLRSLSVRAMFSYIKKKAVKKMSEIRSYLGKRYDTNEIVRVFVKEGIIQSIESAADNAASCPWIAPGLFDIQINGGNGVTLVDPKLTEEQTLSVFKKILREGNFRTCLTLTTHTSETMIHSAHVIARTIEHHPEYKRLITGIHLEGPFLSPNAKGAHPVEYCREYDMNLIDAIQSASGGLVKIITLSPTYPNANEFIRHLVKKGIVVSLGHTDATPNAITAAIEAGATCSTHIGNATTHLLPKKENYFFAQLVSDKIWAGMIADSFHLSPMLMQIIIRTKGLNRLILVSDQAGTAGLPPGRYTTDLCELEILPNGKITLYGDQHLLAGASYPLAYGLMNVMKIAGLSLAQAYPLCTTHPAALLGVSRFSNSDTDFLEPGSSADFLIFKEQPAEYGPYGITDTDHFVTGKLLFDSIIYQGVNVLEK